MNAIKRRSIPIFPSAGKVIKNVLKIIRKLAALLINLRTRPNLKTRRIEACYPKSKILVKARNFVVNVIPMIVKSKAL